METLELTRKVKSVVAQYNNGREPHHLTCLNTKKDVRTYNLDCIYYLDEYHLDLIKKDLGNVISITLKNISRDNSRQSMCIKISLK